MNMLPPKVWPNQEIFCKTFLFRASLVAQMVKNLPARQETQVQFLGWEDLLEKEMTTHSSVLAWKIPWSEEPVAYRLLSLWGRKESDPTEQLTLHFLEFWFIELHAVVQVVIHYYLFRIRFW